MNKHVIITKRVSFVLVILAALLLVATVCDSVYSQELSRGTVVWGINRMGDNPEGVLVVELAYGGAAEKSGLSPGDIILSVDGSPVKTVSDLKEKIKASRPYTPVQVVFLRSGERMEKPLLPFGALRLELKEVDNSFTIPGARPVVNKLSPMEALDSINILKKVIIDRKTGKIALIGTYDPKYATGPIPYLDLLKTALKYPEPKISLNDDVEGKEATESIKQDKNQFGVTFISVLLGMPAAEMERQQVIREMAATYGITREEYIALYNYAFLDAKGEIAPPEIGRIFVKVCRNAGLDDAAAAYGELTKAADDKTKVSTSISIMEKLGLPADEVKQLRYSEGNWGLKPGDMLIKMYKQIPMDIKDKRGKPLTHASLSRVVMGTAPTSVMYWTGNRNCYIHISPESLPLNTSLTRILYEADYAGKTFLIRPDLFANIKGQTTYSQYMSKKVEEIGNLDKLALDVDARFWFEPKRVEMLVSPDKNVVTFGASEIRFTTNMKTVNATTARKEDMDKIINIYNDWCAQYTDNYDLYAQVLPAFHSLRESAKMVALAKWLNSEKITVNLDDVKQEQWQPPDKIIGFWRCGEFFEESPPGKFYTESFHGVTGGVTFKPKNTTWTAVKTDNEGETGVSEQLKLSSQLGEKAVEATKTGTIEEARYLSELSAQAMTGSVTRGDLIKLNVPLAEPVQLPASPEEVLLQKEMIKETYNEINEMSQNPAAKEKSATKLGEISNIYNNMRNNPASASDYLQKLQTGKLLETSGPVVRPVPARSAEDGSVSIQLQRELLGSLSDTIHKRISGTNEQAQEIIKSLKANKPPSLESTVKNIDNLVPGDIILMAPVPFKDREKAGMKDVLISNGVNLLDRWGSNNRSSPASHAAVFLGEKNGKRWYMDNTSAHGPVIKEEHEFLKEYGQRQMDVATLVGEPISPAEGDAIFKAAHELRDEGITYGIGENKMVCSDASRWLLLKAGREIPSTQSENAKILGITTRLNKKDFVSYSPADFYDDEQFFVIHSLDLQRK